MLINDLIKFALTECILAVSSCQQRIAASSVLDRVALALPNRADAAIN
jgi:hypothetical protein